MAVPENNGSSARWTQRFAFTREPMAGAFFWLSAFYLVYCARPEDWIPGLTYIPLAKISGIFALLGLLTSAGRSKRGFRDLPREAFYLLGIICVLFASALLSTICLVMTSPRSTASFERCCVTLAPRSICPTAATDCSAPEDCCCAPRLI